MAGWLHEISQAKPEAEGGWQKKFSSRRALWTETAGAKAFSQ